MEESKIKGRSRRRKYKNQMCRSIAVLLALMLSFSSFGTATAYADAAEGSKTESQPEKVESEKWTEKTILDSGKQTDGVSVTKDASEKKLEMTMKAEMTMERQTIRMIPSNVRPSRIP